jgi:hypothetical protein
MARATLIVITLAFAVAAWADAARVNLSLSEAVKLCVAHLRLKPEEAQALAAQKAVAIALASKDATTVAGVGAVLSEADADALVEAHRSLAHLRQNPTVTAAARFGATPTLDDLDALTVDRRDLYALLKCRVGDCDVKLSAAELARLRAVIGPARVLDAALHKRLAAEYKKLLLARVKAYLAEGDRALGSYADQSEPVNAQTAFAALAREQADAAGYGPEFAALLEGRPATGSAITAPAAESFVYWAQQKFGDSKPVTSLVQVLIHRAGGRTFVASKQLYASHYTEAGLMVAELTPFADAEGRERTLVVNAVRLRLDLLGGAFGFVKRRAAQPRLLDALKESLAWLRLSPARAEAQPEARAHAAVKRPAGPSLAFVLRPPSKVNSFSSRV